MLEKIEVGKTYKGISSGVDKTVKYIGDSIVLYEFYSIEARNIKEFAVSIEVFKQENKELPKEPKKLGQLYYCNKERRTLFWDSSHDAMDGNWQPVTINEKGEVYSVE